VAPDVPKTISYPVLSLQGILQETAKNYPADIAIVYGVEEITYEKLDLLSNQFAHALIKLGVKKGDRVAISCERSSVHNCFFRILKSGAVVTQ